MKNRVALGLASLALVSSSLAHAKNCAYPTDATLPRMANERLSGGWGPEFVGADLAREYILKLSANEVPIGTLELVSLADLPERTLSKELLEKANSQTYNDSLYHGTAVQNIILGNTPYGISPFARLIFAPMDWGSLKEQALDAIKHGVRLFPLSIGISDADRDSIESISSSGAISVRSAGNGYPDWNRQQALPAQSIIIGNLSPLGGVASDSSAYEEVTVAAPGRNYTQVHGELRKFNGTSGAQPLASGCIANLMAILPEITQDEIKTILIQTAIPTLNLREQSHLNGAGTINCYRALRSVERLSKNWPGSRASIEQASTYEFTESDRLFGTLKSDHPTNECSDKSAEIKSLRERILLDIDTESDRKKIIALYRSFGLALNAHLYESLDGIKMLNLDNAAKFTRGTEFETDIYRLMLDHPALPTSAQQIEQGLNSKDEDSVMLAALLAEKTGINSGKTEHKLLRLVSEKRLNPRSYIRFQYIYFKRLNLSRASLQRSCDPITKEDSTSDMALICSLLLK